MKKLTNDAIEKEIKNFVKRSPLNKMVNSEKDFYYDEPLVAFADSADPLYEEYKKIIGPEHMTPREALALSEKVDPSTLGEHISVISYILPIAEATRKTNRAETKVPSRYWSHTRYYGELLNDAVRKHVVEYLKGAGYKACAPGLPGGILKMFRNEKGMYSNWSERHNAFAAGLGTFGLSDGFITERGIAHRCGSIVVALELTPTPRKAASHYANCLFYATGKCESCIKRCPASAITEKGHDKKKCQEYLNGIGYSPRQAYDVNTSVFGCGLCQTKVPCEDRNPVKKK